MFTARILSLNLLLMSLLGTTVLAQTIVKPPETIAPGVTVTAAAHGERVRFTAPSSVVQMRLDVLADSGQTLFDLSTRGNVLDWSLFDSVGERLKDGAYLCVVTVKQLSGRLSQRLGAVIVQEKHISLEQLTTGQLTAAQQQAVGPVEGNAALTLMKEGETAAATVVAHDGTNGQVVSTKGALTFRTGDFFGGKEVEQMRLTEEGNLGLGTDKPEARLDVNGMIRARQGFQFSDGSVLNLSPQGTGLRLTLPSGETARINFAPTSVTGTAHRIPKFAADGSTLQDSNLYQDPTTGYIGIGTTTPAHPFVVRRNGGSLGVHSVGELFVDRDDRNRSASLTVGTAGTLKWIFGMPSGGDGFQVYDLTNNVSRFFVDPTSGNVGIGTTTPATKLTVFTPSFSYGFSQTNGTTTVSSYVDPNGGWLGTRSNHPLYFFTNGGLQQMTLATNGNVGIGTAGPGSALEIRGTGLAAQQRITDSTSGNSLVLQGGAGNGMKVTGYNYGAGQAVPLYLSVDGANTILNSGGGNVGIGTTTPNATLQVAGNVTQSRDKGGFVKAMIFVGDNGTIFRCYNGQTGSSSGNCGFSINHFANGGYGIDFGFQVNDRFVSVTPQYFNYFGHQLVASVGFFFQSATVIDVRTSNDSNYESTEDTPFMIIVY